VGPDFYLGDLLSLLFATNFVFQSSVLPNRVLLAATIYQPKAHSLIRLTEGLVNLALTVVLIRYFEEAGVLLASIVATTLFSAIAMNVLSQKFFKEHDSATGWVGYCFYGSVASVFLLCLSNDTTSLWGLLGVLLFAIFTLFYLAIYRRHIPLKGLYEKMAQNFKA